MVLKYFLKVLSKLPLWNLHLHGRLFKFILCYIFPYRKKVITENIQNSFPNLNSAEVNSILKDFYGYFTDIFVEFIKANSISKKNLIKRVEIIHLEKIEKYLKNNQSIILVTGHQGNWEWAIQRLGLTPYTFEVIYQKLQNKGFNDFTFETRTRFGNIQLVEKADSIKSINENKETRAICILSDQSPRNANSAYWIDFLNQDTAFTKGMEKFAKNLNYPVFYVELLQKSRGYYSLRFEELDSNPMNQKIEGELTKLFAKELESSIKRNPEQYLWSHRRWKLKRNH